MAQIASERLVSRLAEWGVDTVFGLPGDGINGIMEGLRRHRDRVRFVLVHHEEAAAFMATGYAKATGRIGVCLATSGPGGIHLANGLYDAKLDHAPVLAITGMQETSVLGTGYQQGQPGGGQPGSSPVMSSTGDAAHLSLPNDIQVADAGADPWQHVAPAVPPASAPIYLAPPHRPNDIDLSAAAEVLNAAERPAILVGIGARGAGTLVESVADTLGAPIVKTLPGKMAVPDTSPYTTGGIGLLGTRPSAELVDDVDTLLMLGTNFPYTKHLPKPGKVRVVQVEADAARAGLRLPTEVPVIGDVRATLEALLPMLHRNANRAHLDKYQKKMGEWRSQMAALRSADREPIAPQFLAGLVDELAADDAILTCDSGTVATWAARYWTIRGAREFYLSGNLATMAPGLPYAIAMQYAYPDRQVISFIGDGGFAMLMAEFHTAAWHRLPVKVVIEGQIRQEQMVLGYPEHGVRYGEPQPDYAAWARGCGGFGARVEKPGDLPDALRAALAHPGPALVDVAVDPNEPPMPSKVTYEQAKNFGLAFLRGQPHRAAIASTLFADRIEEMKHG